MSSENYLIKSSSKKHKTPIETSCENDTADYVTPSVTNPSVIDTSVRPRPDTTHLIQIPIQNFSMNPLPSYATRNSAALDLCPNIEGHMVIEPHKRVVIPTGISIVMPTDVYGLICSHPNFVMDTGTIVLNSSTVIDTNHHDEIKVILLNLSTEICIISRETKIAQMVIQPRNTVDWLNNNKLSKKKY